MKRIILAVLVVVGSFVNVYDSFANECGFVEMPVYISSGSFFVADATILAMDGDLTKPIIWTGDENYWGESPTEVYVHKGVPGILVSGTGHDFKRWNLRQEGHSNNGWLPIEDAFPLHACLNVYTRGKLTPGANGHDWKGKGPAFWYVDPKIGLPQND